MESSSVMLLSAALFTISMLLTAAAAAADNMTTAKPFRDGETLISSGGVFELGFFSPDGSPNRYLGIWYHGKSPLTVVWVANRAAPTEKSSGVLKLSNAGALAIHNRTGGIVWSASPSSPASLQNPVAELQDSGNLVVREGRERFLWQSFDHPTDTHLPDMKLGIDLRTGLDRFLSSWKSADDPSVGEYAFRMDRNGYPQVLLWKGSDVLFRNGPWNGLRFSGAPQLRENPIYRFSFVCNETEIYYLYELEQSVVSRMVLTSAGLVQRYTWADRTQSWVLYLSAQMDNCDNYATCGAYGRCDVSDSPVCRCLEGFRPRYPEAWGQTDWSNGCVRRAALSCSGGGDGFKLYSGIKLPDTRRAWFDTEMSQEQCRDRCRRNCSCTAYTRLNISGDGSGCLLWFDDLIDIRILSENGQDIYIRMASSELDRLGSHRRKPVKTAVISIAVAGTGLFALSLLFYLWRRKTHRRPGNDQLETPSFDYETISKATHHFSSANKLGQGGFGPVYKGNLDGNQEIAVKVLSNDSNQGVEEFKNEAQFIAKLQHRNLVKLHGCCIQKEKMLIYEYMPSGSLDHLIFDEASSRLLNWQKRFNIINGIARGILYLHHDSRLRIIHRDLKASNILLDAEMNPKISDFGLARGFGGNETGASTGRVVGTHGYMSPEYAIDGLFSVKSDVFSFGVLVLEIVSGKRNRGFSHPDHNLNLLGHAWMLHHEKRSLELMDPSMGEPFSLHQVVRTIQVALLCVQLLPEDRPSMPSVVLMLGGESPLVPPKEPGFYMERKVADEDPSSSKDRSWSTNEMSVSFLGGR